MWGRYNFRYNLLHAESEAFRAKAACVRLSKEKQLARAVVFNQHIALTTGARRMKKLLNRITVLMLVATIGLPASALADDKKKSDDKKPAEASSPGSKGK